jgi:hypothetical protein
MSTPTGAFEFASPSGFSDWTKYAGFDRTTGMLGSAPTSLSDQPVEPISSLSDLGQKIIAPVANTFNKLSAVGSSLSSGDMAGAYNAFNQSASSFGTPTDTTPKHDFSTRWGG